MKSLQNNMLEGLNPIEFVLTKSMSLWYCENHRSLRLCFLLHFCLYWNHKLVLFVLFCFLFLRMNACLGVGVCPFLRTYFWECLLYAINMYGFSSRLEPIDATKTKTNKTSKFNKGNHTTTNTLHTYRTLLVYK